MINLNRNTRFAAKKQKNYLQDPNGQTAHSCNRRLALDL